MYPDPLESGQQQRSRVAAVHERTRTGQLAVTAMQESDVCRGYKGAVAAPAVESVEELQSRWVNGLIFRTT